ncbi:hypothetical protein [Actinokineospora sp. HUAS TT18]|uniref:hypothetical protein n=1 Tax=Actinokineospora sp. HUAS TT18 TaxID=3447451 RepID=UPI003F5260F8
MIADEQDRTVTRLRHELGAVGVRTHADQVDRMLRRVHTRRREQRQHRIQMVAALAVVLIAVAGAFVVSWGQGGEPEQISVAKPVIDWPLRGDLAGDADLLKRAEETWRSGANPPTGEVFPVYAGTRTDRTASLVVVALVTPVDRVHSRVAFVTGKVSANQQLDKINLKVRATTLIGRGQRAIGFLNATFPTHDDQPRGGGGLGFILAEPKLSSVGYRSSMIDEQMTEKPPVAPDGVAWFVPQPGVAAWNSVIEIPANPVPVSVNFAAGVYEANIIPVTLTTSGTEIKASGEVRDGDLIVTGEGLVGVVTGSDGVVDTRLSEFYRVGDLRTAITKHPVRLVERDGGVSYEQTGPGEIRPGNRIVLADGDLVVNVAKVGEGSRVERSVDPATTFVAMRVRNR